MDVHVHGVARQVEKQDQRRPVAGREGRSVAGFRCAYDERIADRATAHEHVALAARRPRLRGALREAAHFERPLAMGDREQGVHDLAAPEGGQPLERPIGGWHVEQGAVVARERERDVGTGQGKDAERFDDRASLRRLGAQELPPGGRIEEQRAHRHRRPALPHRILHRLTLSPHDADPRAGTAVGGGLELEARHGGDRRERLAPETERRYSDQVRGITDLARGVARQRELGIHAAHPLAVVAHADECLAAVFHLDPDGPGAGVERVLDQLLHDRGWPLDHLTRRDLIGDLRREHRDLRRHSGSTSVARTQPCTPS